MIKVLVFLLLVISCSKFRSPSREIASVVDLPREEKISFIKSRLSEYAKEMSELYPSDEYFILGWGINANPLMKALKESGYNRDSLREVPVTKMKGILPEGFSEDGYSGPEYEYHDKLFVLQKRREKLFSRILPSAKELGTKKLVIYRSLWAGHTFAAFIPELVLYLKNNGYQLPLNIEFLADSEWRAKSIQGYLDTDRLDSSGAWRRETLESIKEGEDFKIVFKVDRDVSTLITNEVRDGNFGSSEYNNMMEGGYQKLGITQGELRAEDAMSIISQEHWSGFSFHHNDSCHDYIGNFNR